MSGTTELRWVSTVFIDRLRYVVGKGEGREAREAVVLDRIRAVAERYEGSFRHLSDEDIVVVGIASGATPVERAARAAHAALTLRSSLSGARVAVTTGRAADPDQAMAMALEAGDGLIGRPLAAEGVVVDELSADLLEASYRIAREREGSMLLGEIPPDEISLIGQAVLGKPVPCLGRRRELAFLRSTFEEAMDDRALRVVLLKGPPGIGKTRIAVELHRDLSEWDSRWLLARAISYDQTAPGAMLRTLLRSAAGLGAGRVGDLGWVWMRSYVESLQLEEPRLAAEILGELAGTPSPDAPSPALKAAREDPSVLLHWSSIVLPQWLRAECELRPLVVMLDDVQWADAASLAMLDRSLRTVGEAPIFVLALSRGARDTPPSFFRVTGFEELAVGPLTARWARDLLRSVLPDLDDALVEEIVDRGGGNPFYVQELLRAHAAGRSELPETVMATVEATLEGLSDAARRALRAMSVFESPCSPSMLAEVLGSDEVEQCQASLEELVDREVLEPIHGPVRDRAPYYRFRHPTLRETAYAMLPEVERRTLHAGVAQRLARSESRDPAILAEHWHRAGDGARVAELLVEAANRAFGRGDISGAAALIDRALALEPPPEVRGELLCQRVGALMFVGELESLKAAAYEAIELLPRGGRLWLNVVATWAYACSVTSDFMGFAVAMGLLAQVGDELEECGAAAVALQTGAVAALIGVGPEAATPLRQRLLALDRNTGEADAVIHGWTLATEAVFAEVRGDPVECLALRERALASFEEAGDPVGIVFSAAFLALVAAELGIEGVARRALDRAETLGGDGGFSYVESYLEVARALLELRHARSDAYRRLVAIAETGSIDVRALAGRYVVPLALARDELAPIRKVCEGLGQFPLASTKGHADIFLGLLAMKEHDVSAAERHLELADAATQGGDLTLTMWLAREKLRLRMRGAREQDFQGKVGASHALDRLWDLAGALDRERRRQFWRDGFLVAEMKEELESFLRDAGEPRAAAEPIPSDPIIPAETSVAPRVEGMATPRGKKAS